MLSEEFVEVAFMVSVMFMESMGNSGELAAGAVLNQGVQG
jgi:hypothetical protein